MAFKIKKTSPKAKTQENESSDSILGESPLGRPEDNLAGVESVDRVMLASENVFDWGHRNRKYLIAGLAVLIIGVLSVAWFINNKRVQGIEQSAKLYNAYISYIAPVGDEIDNDEIIADGDPSYSTSTARLEAVYETTKTSSSGTSGVAELTRLLHASTAMGLGKPVEQDTLTSYANYASTPLQTSIGDVALAIHEASNGDLDGAIARLDALAASIPELELPMLEQRAALIELYGTSDAALKAWREAAAAAEGTNAEADMNKRVAVLELQQGLVDAGDTNSMDAQDNE